MGNRGGGKGTILVTNSFLRFCLLRRQDPVVIKSTDFSTALFSKPNFLE